jgi:hypothetical protein
MQNFKPLPARETVLAVVTYDPVTGVFTRTASKNCPWTVGARAGHITPKGYRLIFIAGIYYMEHRIAWLLECGKIPHGLTVDHINGDKGDNRIVNLRLATDCENSCYRPRKSNNRSGYKGVYMRENGKYRAVITVNKQKTNLGTFDNKEDAYNAYCKAAIRLHGQFAKLE